MQVGSGRCHPWGERRPDMAVDFSFSSAAVKPLILILLRRRLPRPMSRSVEKATPGGSLARRALAGLEA